MIVYEDSRPVEIQVRTKMQDAWAQISEKLGDIWGRGLRYGDGPDQPDHPADPAEPAGATRSRVVQALLQLGDATSHLEAAQRELDGATEQLLQLPAEQRKEQLERIEAISAELATWMDNLHDQMGNFLRAVRVLGGRQ